MKDKTKQTSSGDSALTGTVVHISSGQSVGNCGPGTSDVGEVVIPADHRYGGGVAGGE
jgi:hypothetical protein